MAKTALLFLVLAIFCFAFGQSATVSVTVGANNLNAFSPTTATLNVGDTITFTWSSGFHTVTSASTAATAQAGTNGTALGVSFDKNPCSSSACTFTTAAFNTAGTAGFYCRFHVLSNSMFGTIVVGGAAGTSAAAAASSVAAAASSVAAAASSVVGASVSAAAASSVVAASSGVAASSNFIAGSSAQAGSSLNLGTGCGNGIVNSGEQCDLGSASKRIWELNCCAKRTCQFLPANIICGSLSRAAYLANYCYISRTKTCNSSGKCVAHYLAAGQPCVSKTGAKGTCTAGTNGAVTCVLKA